MSCFVTYNFMQDYNGSDLKHIYHFLKSGDAYNIENIIEVIKVNTGRLKEIIYFIDICLFDSLIGNNDRHGRNLGLISNASGYTLAPCYDNPSYFAIEDEFFLGSSFKISCDIKTMYSEKPDIKGYAQEFIRLGYKSNVADFFKKIHFNKINELITTSFISEKRKMAFMQYMEAQAFELKNAL